MVDGVVRRSAAVETTIALVTATHARLRASARRSKLDASRLGPSTPEHATYGQAGQAIFVGDVVQTRRNDSASDVQNRQNWVVKTISNRLMSILHPLQTRPTSAGSVHEYAASHLHLAYATTVYGVQGETPTVSLVGPGVDAAGLYVGLTRGKTHNAVVLVAPTESSAKNATRRDDAAATWSRRPSRSHARQRAPNTTAPLKRPRPLQSRRPIRNVLLDIG